MDKKENSFNNVMCRLSIIESMIQFAYYKSQQYNSIEKMRADLKNHLEKYEITKMKHIESLIENPIDIDAITGFSQKLEKIYEQILQ